MPSRDRPDHFYGGQAVLEGVMMRGRDHWAIAVRKPDTTIHLESHDIDSVAKRHKIFTWPGLRGVIALGQALAIGVKALTVSANESAEEDQKLTKGQMAVSMGIAIVFFIGLFVVGPTLVVRLVERRVGTSILVNIVEGLFRVAIFLAYLALIGLMKDIRRVFQYHGAEHKTIAAYEHEAPLEPSAVDRFSTLHVRCGTNFLLIVMILTILVFALFGTPTLWWRILSRIIAIPLIAGLAYELLRLGARYEGSLIMRILMAPGLWLQKITTRPPGEDQIVVAIAWFQELRRAEADRARPKEEAATDADPAAVPLEPPIPG